MSRAASANAFGESAARPGVRGSGDLVIAAVPVRLRLMLRFGVVALGVSDVRRAAEFWSAALGYELREDGFGEWAKVLVPPDGAGMAIALQLSRTPPQDHPRLHSDLHAGDAGEQEAEAARLSSLGARWVDWDSYPEDPDFIVLEDPEGNRFCIVDLSYEHTVVRKMRRDVHRI